MLIIEQNFAQLILVKIVADLDMFQKFVQKKRLHPKTKTRHQTNMSEKIQVCRKNIKRIAHNIFTNFHLD